MPNTAYYYFINAGTITWFFMSVTWRNILSCGMWSACNSICNIDFFREILDLHAGGGPQTKDIIGVVLAYYLYQVFLYYYTIHIKYTITYSVITEAESGVSVACWSRFWWEWRLNIFPPVLPFSVGENTSGCTSEWSGANRGYLILHLHCTQHGTTWYGTGAVPHQVLESTLQ